jgi:hypothetical protein
MGWQRTCVLCEQLRDADSPICRSCRPAGRYVGSVTLTSGPGAVILFPDGDIEFRDGSPTESNVRVRIGSSNHPEVEAHEHEVWWLDRAQREVVTSVYDHRSRHFRKEWRVADSGALVDRKEGPLDNQDLHGRSGKSGWRPPSARLHTNPHLPSS